MSGGSAKRGARCSQALVLSAVLANLGAVALKPKSFPLAILGVQVDVPVKLSFDMNTEGEAVAVQLAAEANLGYLQEKALDVARALPVPKGNCDRNGINPVVNSIDAASISPSENVAIVVITGHVTAWVCAKAAGFKTEGPKDSVTLTARIRPVVIDGKQIGLQLATPVTVKTGNALTGEVVSLFTGDINGSITNTLTNALNTDQARAKLPKLAGFEGTIKDATFAADGDKLLIRAHAYARMNSDTLSTLLEAATK